MPQSLDKQPGVSPTGQGLPAAAPLVLVVDDSALDRRMATALLEKHTDLRLQTAVHGRDALAMMAREMPALVLTDLQMPEMDGLELVETVRQDYPDVPVILMTANGSEDIAIQALQKGAASYVPKRKLAQDLVATVERLLQAAVVDRRRQQILSCMRNLDCYLELENEPEMVPLLVTHFQDHVLRMGLCDNNSKIRVGVALEEALLNAIYHGNLELDSELRHDGSDTFQRLADERRYQLPYAARRVHLQAKLTTEVATFVIRDEGSGFDVANLPDPTDPENLLKPTGRGILLIRLFMDEVYFNERGNEITLLRRRPAKSQVGQ